MPNSSRRAPRVTGKGVPIDLNDIISGNSEIYICFKPRFGNKRDVDLMFLQEKREFIEPGLHRACIPEQESRVNVIQVDSNPIPPSQVNDIFYRVIEIGTDDHVLNNYRQNIDKTLTENSSYRLHRRRKTRSIIMDSGGFLACKQSTRIEWNPAASGSEQEPGPESKLGSGSEPGNNVENDEDGMPRYAGYRAELRSLEVGSRGTGIDRCARVKLDIHHQQPQQQRHTERIRLSVLPPRAHRST
ncbi:hypothetical protein WN55_05889 [Dufourea novaeangliae]|uniref:Uncharacterized protein n=1 Tax=Dufourea novaeangliae TaxID=178035 RepID=A0A154PMY6_DUFNO|nr:hypothetical protein WN55_05889 [Dufourea novaeangliae]